LPFGERAVDVDVSADVHGKGDPAVVRAGVGGPCLLVPTEQGEHGREHERGQAEKVLPFHLLLLTPPKTEVPLEPAAGASLVLFTEDVNSTI
jgi:hypothetical protein